MQDTNSYGRIMAKIAENYLSVTSRIMSPYGIERNFAALMCICEKNGAITQKELGDTLSEDKVTIMRTVDYLSDLQLVIRKQNAADRRCQILEATDKGKALIPIIESALVQTNQFFFEDFTPEESRVFKHGLEKLQARVLSLPESDFIILAEKRTK